MTLVAPYSNIRRLAATLFALGFLLRVLVPAGWMPAHDGHALTLAPCSGWADALVPGQAIAEADADDHGKGEHKGKPDTSAPCTFAAGPAEFASPATPAALSFPIVALAAQPFAATLVSIGKGLVAPPPPSTGPPLQS